MRSKAFTLLVVIATLGTGGALLQGVANPVWTTMRAKEPALRLDTTAGAAGQGATLALLGGFRALVADALWIRLYVLWERRDLAATDTLVHLVPAVDPRPVYFWVNGARIVAHDFSLWRTWSGGGYDAMPPEAVRAIEAEQGRRAIAHLETARQFHPRSADLWIERATIELNRLRDPAAAAESFRRAWEQPGAPFYAARLHAEMLRRAGRPTEALAWLKKLHPTLPPNDDGAAAETVLARIRELERDLNVPATEAYRP